MQWVTWNIIIGCFRKNKTLFRYHFFLFMIHLRGIEKYQYVINMWLIIWNINIECSRRSNLNLSFFLFYYFFLIIYLYYQSWKSLVQIQKIKIYYFKLFKQTVIYSQHSWSIIFLVEILKSRIFLKKRNRFN